MVASIVGVMDNPATPDSQVTRPVLGSLRVALDAAEKALTEHTWALSEDELAEAMRLLADVGNATDRCLVQVVADARERGTGLQHGWSTVDWVIESTARALSPARAAQLLRVATVAHEPGMEEFLEAVSAGALPLAKADQIARFARDVRPLASREDVLADVQTLLRAASDDGEQPGLSERELAAAITYAGQFLKPARLLEREEEARRLGRALYKSDGPAGMASYPMLLDAEGAAVVDAALSALSRPVREPDGTPDPRSAATRRADALVEVVRRGVSAPGEVPRTPAAQVMVTIPYDQLGEQVRGAGLTMSGQVLSPSTIRKIACDAGLIPVVLGGRGEILDVGQPARLFAGQLRRALWLRDRHCTFPGCTVPAQWCAAHHVVWWSRGGATSLANGALLCDRHHTVVHRRDLSATVSASGVTWHL